MQLQGEKKRQERTSGTHGRTVIGPLLVDTIRLQRQAEAATSYPSLEHYGGLLAALCQTLGDPIVWPVGDAAERLAGAAVLLSKGRVRVRGWSDGLAGDQVLLACTVAATPLGLLAAASHARALGATTVHGCAIELHGRKSEDLDDALDSYSLLEPAGRVHAARRGDARHARPLLAT
jgi:hypothetical protein